MDVKTFFKAFRHRSLADELEIEKLTAERDDFRAKFKKAVADLEKQAGEIDQLKSELEAEALVIAGLREANSSLASGNALLSRENVALRPDALAMRRKRQMDRDGRKGRG